MTSTGVVPRSMPFTDTVAPAGSEVQYARPESSTSSSSRTSGVRSVVRTSTRFFW